ncbi:protein-L-isoaspartate(D-aspartate) O-methyltransferase [Amycolatopsis arida]|uniref:Protein-L-isoaspartate O-methyltransferase n=1 Tax=Amycolatopsis arida TaxID=587909 RepID=A0A1I5KLR4_9PSEU|nr:methyltransferase domain-containing protein [Amycolatopsis arida]TDX97110.1 protein-L-isoaspartate(D-aspartate) O-methyltransferase [Amycolatopsis arida]SFO86014.1 protein-L-isoaspartate(D-aspartate) O-methyltransferase [Amycolatopsis arida]
MLAERLAAAGWLPADWAGSFAAVDRGAFVPARAWVDDEYGSPHPIDRDADPTRWRAAVYADVPIVTQLDDGATVWPATGGHATSSASQPRVVLEMLTALDVHPGHRVLEVGTGTGYNAALLAHRLGDDQVVTVEVDPTLAELARARLAAAGYKPMVICGDGAVGWPAGTPYHRVVSTAAVVAGHVPYPWVEQTRPGGLILTPWGTPFRNGGLLRLTVHDDGAATGRIVGDAAFMRLRQHRAAAPFGHAARLGDLLDASTTAEESTTTVRPLEVATGHAAFAIGVAIEGVQSGVFPDAEPGHVEVLLYDVRSESGAAARITPTADAAGRWPVRQHGPRRLWDEVETAYTWWALLGRPERTRYGVTVTPTRQQVWLDHPSNIVPTP